MAISGAYNRGYLDATIDAHGGHGGKGYDPSCPGGHSESYCQNYQSGYVTGWRSVTTTTQAQGGGQGQQARANAGYLQGVSGVPLKGTHTQAFLANESSAYWAGYKHGVSDGNGVSYTNSTDWPYIQQHGKEFAFHTQQFNNGYVAGFCSIAGKGAGIDSGHWMFVCPHQIQYRGNHDPNSYKAGYQYGTNEWNQYGDANYTGFECPLADTAPHSNFCKGYDAALAYQNSDI